MKSLLTGLSALALVGSANAALVTGLTIESADLGSNGNMTPSDVIDGQGLPGNTPALTGTHSTTWLHHWFVNSGPNGQQITIDLEGNYALDTVHVWNYNETSVIGRGFKNTKIYVAPDENEANLVKLVTDGTGTHDNGSGDFELPQASGLNTYPGFDLDLSGVTNSSLLDDARLVRFEIIDNYGDRFVGLAEVQFGGNPAAVIPTPAAVPMALVGLAGMMARRRK